MTQQLPEGFDIKSFWSRPEGTFGMVVAVILGVLATWGLYLLLPFIIILLQNILTAAALFLAVAIVGMVLTNRRFWTLLSGSFKLFMRKVTNIFITIDPIGILKNYVDSLRDQLISIAAQIQNLRGQMGQLNIVIQKNNDDMQKALRMAKAAKDTGKQTTLVLQARSAGRLKQSNITLGQLYKKLEALMRMLNKMQEVSNFMFEDIKQNVDVMERQYKAITAGYKTMKAAMKFIQDASDDKQLYDQTVEYLLNDYGQKLGEIEQFMQVATPFIESIDLQNMAFEEDALKDLENWERRADNLLIGDTKQLLEGSEELYPLLESLDLPTELPAKVRVEIQPEQSTPKKYIK